jgi:hypothetical protein
MCNSGCGKGEGLFFIFDELNRKKKPCLDLKNISDALLFVDVMNFTKKNCIKLDGCCSSRIHTSMAYLSNLINPPPIASDEPGINIEELLKGVLDNNCCKSCCDDID